MASGAFFGALHFGVSSLQLLVCGYGGVLVSQGKLNSGDLVAVSSQLLQLMRAFAGFSATLSNLAKAITGSESLFSIVKTVPSVDLPVRRHSIVYPKSVEGKLKFEDVTFRYPSRPNQVVLEKFNLVVESGQVVALVGASGAGKSTVGVLLERFYDPIEGRIMLDDNLMVDLDPHWLRRQIGIVEQSPALFDASIRENILYGSFEASEEDLLKASKQVWF